MADVEDTTTNASDEADVETAIEDIDIDVDELADEDESTEDQSEDERTESEDTKEEEAEEDVEDKSEDDSSDDTQEDSNEEDSNDEEDSEELSPSERKRLNDEYAKRRIAEKELKEERQRREQENLERYLEEAGDDEDERARRELQVEARLISQERSELLQERLVIGMEKAVADIDLFRTGSDEAKQALVQAVEDFERMYVQKDEKGNPTKVNGDVYQYLNDKAESIRKLMGTGARQEAKAKTIAKAKTETLPTRAPKESKKDDYLDAFLEEANRY